MSYGAKFIRFLKGDDFSNAGTPVEVVLDCPTCFRSISSAVELKENVYAAQCSNGHKIVIENGIPREIQE